MGPRYDVVYRYRGYPAKVQDWAVYRPILGNGRPSQSQPSLLRDRWFQRLTELQGAGWSKLPTRAALKTMGSCAPFGVQYRGEPWYCNRRIICPFCHGRRVLDLFLATFRAVYGTEYYESKTRKPRNYSVIRWTRTKEVPYQDADVVGHLRAWLSEQRSVELPHVSYEGAIVLYSFNPHAMFWRVRKSILLVTRPDVRDPVASTNIDVYERKESPGPRELARMVGYAFRYPLGMLVGDPASTVRLLDLFEGFRTLSRYGTLRADYTRRPV